MNISIGSNDLQKYNAIGVGMYKGYKYIVHSKGYTKSYTVIIDEKNDISVTRHVKNVTLKEFYNRIHKHIDMFI